MALKIVTDLERMGDQCVSIAKRALELNEEPPLKPYIDLPNMAEQAGTMVRESLAAFLQQREELALKVCREDQIVDDMNVQLQRELLTYMMEDPHAIAGPYDSTIFPNAWNAWPTMPPTSPKWSFSCSRGRMCVIKKVDGLIIRYHTKQKKPAMIRRFSSWHPKRVWKTPSINCYKS